MSRVGGSVILGHVQDFYLPCESQQPAEFSGKCCDLIYAQNVFAALYGLAPVGEYEVTFDFGDITYNREDDRARWWGYVSAGKVPAWMFFVKFEGMSEEDAKAMVQEAQPKTPTLFGE